MADAQVKTKNLKKVLDDINVKYVDIDKEDAPKNVSTVKHIVETIIIPKMKEKDTLFAQLYSKIYYTGSYFDGLRTTAATEFDLDLVIKLPFKAENIIITQCPQLPGYVDYNLDQPIAALLAYDVKKWTEVYSLLEDKFFENNFLMQGKINKWMQSILDLAMKDITQSFVVPNDGPVRVALSSSGPARTAQIYVENRKVAIDVDLVPTVLLEGWPPDVRNYADWSNKLTSEDRLCLLVPKPTNDTSVPKDDASRLWRVALPNVEKLVLKDMGYSKELIKTFKVLRDKQNWKSICSYYIKTLILWEIERCNDRNQWLKGNRDIIFLKMLTVWQDAMKIKEIPSFHYPELNLLRGMSDREATKISKFIGRVIQEIKENPEKLYSYF